MAPVGDLFKPTGRPMSESLDMERQASALTPSEDDRRWLADWAADVPSGRCRCSVCKRPPRCYRECLLIHNIAESSPSTTTAK
jgi:hypothetical protein